MAALLKNVALIGASGSVGKVLVDAFLNDKRFNVTVLRRGSSSATYPSAFKVVDVDYDSLDSLTAALAGQDAVVSAINPITPVDTQKKFIDAAIAAGVKRFVPSEFGCDLNNELARALPVFAPKIAIQKYLKEKAESSPLTYTFAYSGPFLDWGLEHQFLLKTVDSKPKLFDGGNTVFSTTKLDTVAAAVLAILSKPEETKNREVRFQSAAISQNGLFALAKEVAPQRNWEPEVVKIDDIVRVADDRLAKGLLGPETFIPYLVRAINDPRYGPKFETLDNELLGLKQVTEAEIKDILRQYLKE
ncbi:uncharacterized protein TrAtP1_003052 [Trichoderma atroviride]|uniref:NmrA-like domain-containing protein n=1 Tax=Hypocrea atroviridis (strain ATCC 20476 / IMI 206040) TaxID=452589 RepID=G9NV64_HYPAI|nr:uncharacterized protein TRIATDRAFT_299709 [Trichoderma atroviride IMI 206040]EHK44885.1 hypothetical protein TRIATDRAFT_299709 [Trichoderma atroviride IMI 206040]UKZ61794.1 hypothetical protein TrAtP1_003052 [Trichoderma atroviride]